MISMVEIMQKGTKRKGNGDIRQKQMRSQY